MTHFTKSKILLHLSEMGETSCTSPKSAKPPSQSESNKIPKFKPEAVQLEINSHGREKCQFWCQPTFDGRGRSALVPSLLGV